MDSFFRSYLLFATILEWLPSWQEEYLNNGKDVSSYNAITDDSCWKSLSNVTYKTLNLRNLKLN